MNIVEVELSGASAKIGTLTEFGTMQFLEAAMTTELEDGREVEILRGAFNPCHFEVKIEGDDRYMRVNIEDVMQDAVRQLVEEIKNDK